ncbi:MAG: DUF493 family protein [Flavobacterium sp.]|nr:DUF493 family protein [Candidatus Neoflavobacterium equi]
MDQKSEDFYKRLKEELINSTVWPSEYLFKFILPASPENVTFIKNSFANKNAQIVESTSKTGKFSSLSVKLRMESAQSVIDKYKELSVIEGIVSL